MLFFQLYQSLRNLRSHSSSPIVHATSGTGLPGGTSSLSLGESSSRATKSVEDSSVASSSNTMQSRPVTMNNAQTNRTQKSLSGAITSNEQYLGTLADDMIAEIFSFLDVTSSLNIRAVSKRFSSISRLGMNRYWETAWRAVKGSIPSNKSSITSSAAWKQEFRWFQMGSRPVITTLTGHKGSVTCLAFAEHNERDLLVSGSDDGSLIVWSISEEKQRDEESKPSIMQHHHRQSKSENVSRLHSLSGHHGPVWGVSVDGNTVCSGSFDKTVKVWELSSGNCLHTLRGHENWVSCVSLKTDLIVSGSWDSTVRLWSVTGNNARHLGNFPTEVGNAVYALDRCENNVAAGSHRQRFELFDIETRQLIHRYDGAHNAKTYAVHFQSNSTLATGGCDGRARVWDTRTRNAVADVTAHSKPVLSVKMGDENDSPFRLATCSLDRLIKIFDIRIIGKPSNEIDHWLTFKGKRASGETVLSAHSDSIVAMCMDETKICSGGVDGLVKVCRFS